MYKLAIDLSLSSSGYTIGNEEKDIIKISTIKTPDSFTTPERLGLIWNEFMRLREIYPIYILILERAFSRYNIATQQLFRVHGIINLFFKDVPQMYYAPTTIKKALVGTGKAKKEEVREKLREWYPDINCRNHDESDSLALMHYYNHHIEKGR